MSPFLKELPVCCVTNEIEVGSSVSIWSVGEVQGGADCTVGFTELGGKVGKGDKVGVVSPGCVCSWGIMEEGEEDEGGRGAILCTC